MNERGNEGRGMIVGGHRFLLHLFPLAGLASRLPGRISSGVGRFAGHPSVYPRPQQTPNSLEKPFD